MEPQPVEQVMQRSAAPPLVNDADQPRVVGLYRAAVVDLAGLAAAADRHRAIVVPPRVPFVTVPAPGVDNRHVRIATWNVNSLKARMDRVLDWLERGQPDVLLMQETKLADDDAPLLPFQMRGYELVHHGEGRWNGVAIASRLPIDATSIVTNFGDGPVRNSAAGADANFAEEDFNPFDEARMLSATVGGIRFVCLYAPNGRVVDSPFYTGKLAWYERLRNWLAEETQPDEPLVLGGDMNVAPEPIDVWSETAAHGGTHVSPREREAFAALLAWGLVDAYRARHPEPDRFSWWDYRAGNFHKNMGMRIDHLLVTRPVAERVIWAEIDREARKGQPVPSDHAPLLIDLDQPGAPLDAGWDAALQRIAARTRSTRTEASR
jgi:exodeoxyribonuclease-3